MKESYKEQPAIDFGHKPYAGSGDAPGVASSFANATGGQVLLRHLICRGYEGQEGYGRTGGCVETQASH